MRFSFFTFLLIASLSISASGVTYAQTQEDASNATEPQGTSAAALGLTELTDDLSRQDLFAEVRAGAVAEDPQSEQEAITFFNLWGPFRFPNDVDYDIALQKAREDSLFGVDISHYTPVDFPIEQLHKRKVLFVYMKATQGTGSLDKKFANFWSRAGKLPKGSEVHRGAYHFLSSGDPGVPAAEWGATQAATFIKVVKANGGLLPTDMPPVVDLEWDKASKDGPDRWKNRSPDEIIAMLKAFLAQVKAQLNRTPMIYTARSWWRGQMKSESRMAVLSGYPLWGADYSKTSRASEVPTKINGVPWALWQYTEGATMAIGFNKPFDANIFKGKTEDFYTTLGVAKFQ
jgi:lysozyme